MVLEPELNKAMKRFVDHVRFGSTHDDAPLFTSWPGLKMDSGMVSNQINSFWKKAMGARYRGRINATIIRKEN